jgi:ketosteroid isomerase-like protein
MATAEAERTVDRFIAAWERADVDELLDFFADRITAWREYNDATPFTQTRTCGSRMSAAQLSQGHNLATVRGDCRSASGQVDHSVGDIGVVAEVVARTDAVVAVRDGERPRAELTADQEDRGQLLAVVGLREVLAYLGVVGGQERELAGAQQVLCFRGL